MKAHFVDRIGRSVGISIGQEVIQEFPQAGHPFKQPRAMLRLSLLIVPERDSQLLTKLRIGSTPTKRPISKRNA